MTPEEALVIRKAKENLDAAELLIQQGFVEIAASRAYYAMFYLTEALLMRKGLHFSSHSAVIAAFGKEYAKTGELDAKFHQNLIKAQAIRQISDYGYNEPLPKNDVEIVIRWAREFNQAVNNYLHED
jgi:uncharacterized protein (UPF0332 family)